MTANSKFRKYFLQKKKLTTFPKELNKKSIFVLVTKQDDNKGDVVMAKQDE